MNSKKICCVAAFAILTLSTSSVLAKTPKYVFFFCGGRHVKFTDSGC